MEHVIQPCARHALRALADQPVGESGDLLKCSFCGKSQKQVKKLIAGPGVYICDECVELCNEIIEERLAESNETPTGDFELRGLAGSAARAAFGGQAVAPWAHRQDGQAHAEEDKKKRELVDLKTVVREAVEGIEPQLTAHQHDMEIVLCEEPLLLQADPVRLSQVVTNILHNAVKYTPPGGKITVSTQKYGSEATISIRDNGIGILPEIQAKIFDLFSQSPGAMGREEGGIGIGLSISRKLIEMHGGRIEVFSEGAGRGSEFIIHMPLA